MTYPGATTMPQDVKQELLDLLRSRFAHDKLAAAVSLIGWLGLDVRDAQTPARLKAAIVRAITRDDFPADLVLATRQMCGLTRETEGSRVTREKVIGYMSSSLPRKARRVYGGEFSAESVPLTRRAVELIERHDIVPAVLASLAADSGGGTDEYLAASVRITLTPDPEPGTVRMSVALFVEAVLERWVVAVTDDEPTAEYLCSFTSVVNEAICDSEIQSGVRPPQMHLLVRRVDSGPRERELPLVEHSAQAIARLCGEPRLEVLASVRWFLAELPTNATNEPLQITFANDQSIPLGCRYCYWSAARRTFLTSITVDASAFPRARDYRFILQPFLGTTARISSTAEGRFNVVSVDRWVDRGHGLALVWADPHETLTT